MQPHPLAKFFWANLVRFGRNEGENWTKLRRNLDIFLQNQDEMIIRFGQI